MQVMFFLLVRMAEVFVLGGMAPTQFLLEAGSFRVAGSASGQFGIQLRLLVPPLGFQGGALLLNAPIQRLHAFTIVTLLLPHLELEA